jgi:hypothetical protein
VISERRRAIAGGKGGAPEYAALAEHDVASIERRREPSDVARIADDEPRG